MAVQRNKTESNGETACDETEKSEGLSGMPEIEAIESIISKPSPTSWLGTIKSCRDKDVRRNLIHFASKTRMDEEAARTTSSKGDFVSRTVRITSMP